MSIIHLPRVYMKITLTFVTIVAPDRLQFFQDSFYGSQFCG